MTIIPSLQTDLGLDGGTDAFEVAVTETTDFESVQAYGYFVHSMSTVSTFTAYWAHVSFNMEIMHLQRLKLWSSQGKGTMWDLLNFSLVLQIIAPSVVTYIELSYH